MANLEIVLRNSTQYKLAGPKTFRRSSTKILHHWGGNLQNVEKGMREIYISDGYEKELEVKCAFWLQTGDTSIFNEQELSLVRVMGQVDQAGAEALIVAYDCEPLDYRKLFIHGVKPHIYVALRLFPDVWKSKSKSMGLGVSDIEVDTLIKTPIEELKKNPAWKQIELIIKQSDDCSINERYYYFAKQTVHSANYGIEWATFILNVLEKSGGKVVLTRAQGEFFLKTYRELFPEIPRRCDRVEYQAKKTKMLYNMFGFPYTITHHEILGKHLKELYAWGPQSTVGEITRIAYSRLYKYIVEHNKKWDILVDNHDSYLVQFPILETKECCSKMQEFMNQSLISPIDGAKFNMKSECKIGFNWGSGSDKNKTGLTEIKMVI